MQAGEFLITERINNVWFLGLDKRFEPAHIAAHIPGKVRVYVQVYMADARVQLKESGPSFLVVGDNDYIKQDLSIPPEL